MRARVLASVLLAFCFAGPGVTADESTVPERDWVDLNATDGPGLYESKCAMCHGQNGMGAFILQRRLPPDRVALEARDDLQPAFVRNAVRNGLGLMFPMSRAEVSDGQLDRIVQYLSDGE